MSNIAQQAEIERLRAENELLKAAQRASDEYRTTHCAGNAVNNYINLAESELSQAIHDCNAALRRADKLETRLAEAEALLREWVTCATNIDSGEATAKVEQKFVAQCRAFLASDSATHRESEDHG